MSVNEKIRFDLGAHREKLGISKAEVARRAGITVAAYSRLENGVTEDVKLSTLIAVSVAIGRELNLSLVKPKSK